MNIKDIYKNYSKLVNKKVELKAFVKFHRQYKELGFLILIDGTTISSIQAVYKNKIDNFKQIQKITNGTSVEIKGKLLRTKNKEDSFEILISKIEILSKSDDDYPLQNKEHSYEFLRENAHLRARTNYFYSVFRLRSLIAKYVHDFFYENDFMWIHSPILTANDAEGAGEAFIATTRDDGKYEEDFFHKKTSLTVSGQLNAEAFAMAFNKVYTFSPTFRAENSNTTKHVAEFWMIEPEIAFATYHDLMDNGENLLKYIGKKLLEDAAIELLFLSNKNSIDLEKRIKSMVNSKFIRITYTKAIEILKKAVHDKKITFEVNKIKWGINLASEHEKYLAEEYAKKPIYIYDYPKKIKSFYMLENADKKTVAGFDLLVSGVGEIIGGSSRETNYKKLLSKVKDNRELLEELRWYLDLRRFGMSSSAGYGLGFERLVMYFGGIENIRDVIPFPRTPRSIKF